MICWHGWQVIVAGRVAVYNISPYNSLTILTTLSPRRRQQDRSFPIVIWRSQLFQPFCFVAKQFSHVLAHNLAADGSLAAP